jgi:hypothetical protein
MDSMGAEGKFKFEKMFRKFRRCLFVRFGTDLAVPPDTTCQTQKVKGFAWIIIYTPSLPKDAITGFL